MHSWNRSTLRISWFASSVPVLDSGSLRRACFTRLSPPPLPLFPSPSVTYTPRTPSPSSPAHGRHCPTPPSLLSPCPSSDAATMHTVVMRWLFVGYQSSQIELHVGSTRLQCDARESIIDPHLNLPHECTGMLVVRRGSRAARCRQGSTLPARAWAKPLPSRLNFRHSPAEPGPASRACHAHSSGRESPTATSLF